MMKKKRKPKEGEKKELFLLEMYRPLRQKLKAPLFLTFFFCLSLFLQQLSNFQTLLCVRFKPSSPRTQPLGNRNAYIKREGKKTTKQHFRLLLPPLFNLDTIHLVDRNASGVPFCSATLVFFFPLLLHAALVSSVVECRLYSSRAVPRFLVI